MRTFLHASMAAASLLAIAAVGIGCSGDNPGDSNTGAAGAGGTGGSTATGGGGSGASSTTGDGGSGGATTASTTTTASGSTTTTGNTGWEERSTARVFISGHSLTDNPLADYLVLIADSLGKDHDYNQQIGIGSPIRVRTKGNSFDDPGWPGYSKGKNKDGADMNVIEELKSPMTLGPGELYDTLVITERHDILSVLQWEDTVGFLRHYHDRLIDGNPAGQTLFYHSWLDVDKSAPQAWIEHEKGALYAWECAAAKVNHTLEAEGRTDRVLTLPAGAALVDLVERVLADQVPGISGGTAEKLSQIFNDNVHLTPLGVYFAALVTHASVYRGSPVGAAIPQGVSAQPATAMQQIAWDFVSAYYSAPAPGAHTMEECRQHVSQSVCSSFWGLLDQPQNVAGCQAHFSNEGAQNNPFRWPDPQLSLWPDP